LLLVVVVVEQLVLRMVPVVVAVQVDIELLFQVRHLVAAAVLRLFPQ
jgi:hypothetical protein